MIEHKSEVHGSVAVNMFCSNPACPEVQRKLRDYENGTGQFSKFPASERPLPGIGSGLRASNEWPHDRWDSDEIRRYGKELDRNTRPLCNVRNGLLARYQSDAPALHSLLPFAVLREAAVWSPKTVDENGKPTHRPYGGYIGSDLGIDIIESAGTNAAIAKGIRRSRQMGVAGAKASYDQFCFLQNSAARRHNTKIDLAAASRAPSSSTAGHFVFGQQLQKHWCGECPDFDGSCCWYGARSCSFWLPLSQLTASMQILFVCVPTLHVAACADFAGTRLSTART